MSLNVSYQYFNQQWYDVVAGAALFCPSRNSGSKNRWDPKQTCAAPQPVGVTRALDGKEGGTARTTAHLDWRSPKEERARSGEDDWGLRQLTSPIGPAVPGLCLAVAGGSRDAV